MRNLISLLLIFSLPAFGNSEIELCLDFVELGENYKYAHENTNCLNAVNLGSGTAMYSVGMGYGFSGDTEKEIEYYHLAAEKGVVASYLSLGHALRETDEEQAILWYSLFAFSDAEAAFYAANILAQIYEERGDYSEAEYWAAIATKKQHSAGY